MKIEVGHVCIETGNFAKITELVKEALRIIASTKK